MAFGNVVLLRPLWLILLPVLGVAAWWIARRTFGLAGWERAADAELLRVMARYGHVVSGVTTRLPPAALAAAVLLVLGLAGPGLRTTAPALRNLDGIVIVMDMSPSVTKGGNLTASQAAAALVLEKSIGRPVALVLFSGQPYLASSLTVDPATPESVISVLDAETMPDGGSRPDFALALARKVLREAGTIHGDVVLVSDGGGLNAAAAAEATKIRDAGGRLSTIFVAPKLYPAGMPTPDATGLRHLAELGSGTFENADDTAAIADALASDEARDMRRSDLFSLYYRDFGRYIAGLALIPALLLLRRRRS